MVNTSPSPRTDLPYLRRRIKPGRTAPAPAVPQSAKVPPSSGGLNLSRPAALPPVHSPAVPAAQAAPQASGGLVLGRNAPASSTSTRARKLAALREAAQVMDHEVALLFAAPGIRDIFELNLQERVLRLTALESAVGTMVVSGSTAMAWESVRRVTGGADVDGHTAGSPLMTSGNRPLAGYDGKNALVTLRHIRQLRRAIFINRGTHPMGVQIFSGAQVVLPPPADGTQILMLALRIGNVLELRAEPVPHSWTDQQIWQEFDFTMTHKAPASSYRR